jgi:hypothetical protein
LVFAALSASLVLCSGCSGTDAWKTVAFEQAGVTFSVPDNWSVSVGVPGSDPVVAPIDTNGPELGGGAGAVLSALSVLEDAALVLIATHMDISPQWFSARIDEFIPLERITFTQQNEPYTRNGVSGYAGEGVGVLSKGNVPVYFRTLAVEIEDRAVLITLYAEESERARYEVIFDRILGSMKPSKAPKAQEMLESMAPGQDLGPSKDPLPSETEGGGETRTPDAGIGTDADSPDGSPKDDAGDKADEVDEIEIGVEEVADEAEKDDQAKIRAAKRESNPDSTGAAPATNERKSPAEKAPERPQDVAKTPAAKTPESKPADKLEADKPAEPATPVPSETSTDGAKKSSEPDKATADPDKATADPDKAKIKPISPAPTDDPPKSPEPNAPAN